MNIFQKIIGAFRPEPPPRQAPPTVPPEGKKTHRYRVTEDGLAPRAESLAEYYEIQDLRHQANEIFQVMNYATELATEDGSALDSDPRQGHIAMEKHHFEAHPDSGFELSEGEVQVKGDGGKIETTRISDNWMAKNQSAVWDRESQTFVLSFDSKDGPEMPRSPERLVEEESSKAGLQDRANQIIQAAQFWEEKAKGLDNSAADLQPDDGKVVAPGAAVDPEPVLAEAFYTDQTGNQNFKAFDLENNSSGTIVAGNPGEGRPFGVKLSTKRSERGMEITLERPEIGTTEKVEWAVADGILHYEKYKKG